MALWGFDFSCHEDLTYLDCYWYIRGIKNSTCIKLLIPFNLRGITI